VEKKWRGYYELYARFLSTLEKNMKYTVSFVTLMLLSGTAMAGPYVEYKNDLRFLDKDLQSDNIVHHLRFGTLLGDSDKNLYLEVGPRTDGYSGEVGYKVKNGPLTFKGKWEGSKLDEVDPIGSKLETEIRFSF
jgi:hypothetical protein